MLYYIIVIQYVDFPTQSQTKPLRNISFSLSHLLTINFFLLFLIKNSTGDCIYMCIYIYNLYHNLYKFCVMPHGLPITLWHYLTLCWNCVTQTKWNCVTQTKKVTNKFLYVWVKRTLFIFPLVSVSSKHSWQSLCFLMLSEK